MTQLRNFWRTLAKPIFCVAPMANVTDVAFRRIISQTHKPSVMWTEFVSCEALCSNERVRNRMKVCLEYAEIERPIVAQLFGSKPEQFYKSAQLVQELGFDGIDLNFGCPDKNVCKQGSGAALINNRDNAKEIVKECKRGAGDLPVSVKTRIGFNTIDLDWFYTVVDTEPAAITIHGRTMKEQSLVPAHWDKIKEATALIRGSGSEAIVIGNGDVQSINEGLRKIEETGVDGIMFGRALFGNPWLFQGVSSNQDIDPISRLEKMLDHTDLYQELLVDTNKKSFNVMKKSYKCYTAGMRDGKSLRSRLLESRNAQEVHEIVQQYIEQQEHEAQVEEKLAD